MQAAPLTPSPSLDQISGISSPELAPLPPNARQAPRTPCSVISKIALMVLAEIAVSVGFFLATKSIVLTAAITVPLTLIVILFAICVIRRQVPRMQSTPSVEPSASLDTLKRLHGDLEGHLKRFWNDWWEFLLPERTLTINHFDEIYEAPEIQEIGGNGVLINREYLDALFYYLKLLITSETPPRLNPDDDTIILPSGIDSIVLEWHAFKSKDRSDLAKWGNFISKISFLKGDYQNILYALPAYKKHSATYNEKRLQTLNGYLLYNRQFPVPPQPVPRLNLT